MLHIISGEVAVWREGRQVMVPACSEERVVECFVRYLEHDGATVSRAEFEANLHAKLQEKPFREDIVPLLPAGPEYDVSMAAATVHERLITKLRGDPWKGEERLTWP